MARYYITENGKTRKVDIERGMPLLPKLMLGIVGLGILAAFLQDPTGSKNVTVEEVNEAVKQIEAHSTLDVESGQQVGRFKTHQECTEHVKLRFRSLDANIKCNRIMREGGYLR